jgi:putative NADH-flavin reductase
VTALVRHPEKIRPQERVFVRKSDIMQDPEVSGLFSQSDAVVISLHYHTVDQERLLNSLRNSRPPRVLFVGGAGGLEVSSGKRLLDEPGFPVQYKPTAMGAQKLLERLRDEKEINWTVLAPSAVIAPGERTGKFRLEKDRLLVNEKGESRISVEDFAMALVNELENPRYERARFTVGY